MKKVHTLVILIILLAITLACGSSKQKTPASSGNFVTVTPGGVQPTSVLPTAVPPTAAAPSATPVAPQPTATPTVAPTTTSLPAPTPTPQRIRFAAGTTSATVSGVLLPGGKQEYVLRALAGQIMTVKPSAVTGAFQVIIKRANGAVLGTANAPTIWSGTLPATDDYIVTLQSFDSTGNTNYTLLISIVHDIPPTPEAVKAVINGPTRGQMGQTLTYNSYGSSGPIAGAVWDFGDGSPAVYDAQEVTHIYNAPGTYRLSLTVQGEQIGTGSDTAAMYVVVDLGPEPEHVKAAVNGPGSGQVGESLTFDSYGSSGPIASSVWDFGDGSAPVYDASQVTHIYNAPGTYRVSLTVQGEHVGSGSDTAVMTVVIQDAPVEQVIAVINGPGSGQVGESLTFDSYGSSGPIASSVWDFGDGSAPVYDAPQVTHVFNAPGTYQVSVTVQGEQMGSGSDTAVLTVVIQDVPVEQVIAVINGPNTGGVGQPLLFDSYGSSGPIATSIWDFGDGSSLVYDQEQVGHTFYAPGTYRVSLTVQGEHLGSGDDTAFIDVQIFEKQPR